MDGNQVETILKYINEGKKEGAQLVTGGKKVEGRGHFVAPTVFAGVNDQMKIAQEEVRERERGGKGRERERNEL